jgi:hypothetical protein
VNRIKNAKHWYKNKPLWEKALKNLMKSAVQKSNVDKTKKLTNYSTDFLHRMHLLVADFETVIGKTFILEMFE